MISQKRIEVAGEIVEWLRLAVHDLDVTANMRNRTAISCFAIAQDHHHAIVVLSVNDGVKPCLLRQKARPDPISSYFFSPLGGPSRDSSLARDSRIAEAMRAVNNPRGTNGAVLGRHPRIPTEGKRQDPRYSLRATRCCRLFTGAG